MCKTYAEKRNNLLPEAAIFFPNTAPILPRSPCPVLPPNWRHV